MISSYFSECFREKLDKAVTNVVKLLESRKMTAATAESCTGGLLSELITSVPGASEVFGMGICAYSPEVKQKLLNVPEDVIERYGVVSRETALEMVKGLKKLSGADVCVSVTGVAGPGGGTPETPVGTVWTGFDICGMQFALLADTSSAVREGRQAVRLAAALSVFSNIENVLLKEIRKSEG